MKSKTLLIPFKVIYFIFIAIVHTIFIDLPKNIKLAFTYTFNPEKRKELSRKVEQEKMIKLLKEKTERLERLIYAIMQDSEYLKSDKGKIDQKELKKEVK